MVARYFQRKSNQIQRYTKVSAEMRTELSNFIPWKWSIMHLDRCAMVDTQTYKFGLLDRINQRKRNVNIYLNSNNKLKKKNGNIFIANTQDRKKLCRDRCEYVLPNRCWSALGCFFCSLYFVLCCVHFFFFHCNEIESSTYTTTALRYYLFSDRLSIRVFVSLYFRFHFKCKWLRARAIPYDTYHPWLISPLAHTPIC